MTDLNEQNGLRCIATAGGPALPVRAARPADLAGFESEPGLAGWVRECGFKAAFGEVLLLPGEAGIGGALLGLGEADGRFAFGALADRLPVRDWRLDELSLARAGVAAEDAVLGFCLGAYRFHGEPTARLVVPPECAPALDEAGAIGLARDLVNMPANVLGPSELADAVETVARRFGAACGRVSGDALEAGYPAIAAVGRGSARPPVMAHLRWQGSGATERSPLISLAGKGVCFDTGGYDIKPSAGMLRMKKDMGGAAVTLGLASLVMRRDLPVRLELRIGCVENSISGGAMRPSDVIRTRAGLSVEVNNTDAEGRLVLADLLAAAAEGKPDMLVDVATLTGAARVALGPDLPALFSNDDALADRIVAAGRACADPVWRLPLWDGYAEWLGSRSADLANVAGKPHAGAIVAALFLRRFVPPAVSWAHLDAYCWNDQSAPGRPEGGEAPALRAVYRSITNVCDQGTLTEPSPFVSQN